MERRKCYFPIVETYLGQGSGGIAYGESCCNRDTFDSLFAVAEDEKFVRKKFHDKASFDYEDYHVDYLRQTNNRVFEKYFCAKLRSFSVTTTITDRDDTCEELRSYYVDMEWLSTPQWELLWDILDWRLEERMVDTCLKALISILLELHYKCNGATYFDVNPCNIFVNKSLLKQRNTVELKLIDYGGLFHPSWMKHSDDSDDTFLANPYFLPSPGLSRKIPDECQPNMLELVASSTLPVFYSIVCSVSMIIDMIDRELEDCIFFTTILDGMGKKTDYDEQTKLYSDYQYQSEFVDYLYQHMDSIRVVAEKKKKKRKMRMKKNNNPL